MAPATSQTISSIRGGAKAEQDFDKQLSKLFSKENGGSEVPRKGQVDAPALPMPSHDGAGKASRESDSTKRKAISGLISMIGQDYDSPGSIPTKNDLPNLYRI
jgi:hypothetical protein